jgi:hypothetical protein
VLENTLRNVTVPVRIEVIIRGTGTLHVYPNRHAPGREERHHKGRSREQQPLRDLPRQCEIDIAARLGVPALLPETNRHGKVAFVCELSIRPRGQQNDASAMLALIGGVVFAAASVIDIRAGLIGETRQRGTAPTLLNNSQVDMAMTTAHRRRPATPTYQGPTPAPD